MNNMQVVNTINRKLPKTPENQKERNGILINAFLFKDDVMDCAVGGNINAYQYNFPDNRGPGDCYLFGKHNYNAVLQINKYSSAF